MTAVVDYQVGNTGNVIRAFERLGEDARLLSSPDELTGEFSLAVLPGVGAYGPASERLSSSGWGSRLTEWAKCGGALLGICLGMQLLCEKGLENGSFPGLGLIPGDAALLGASKIPHMGWNQIHLVQPEDPLFSGIPDDSYVYFVHSYWADTTPDYCVTKTDYICPFSSSIRNGTAIGVQFHPES